MVFNSVAFLVFFILFFYTYWWVCRKGTVKARNIVLIVASYIFYGWWDWRFLSLIIISSLADFLLGQYIFRAHSGSSRKTGLILSLILNLGLLGFFKYFNFFTEGFGEFIHLFGLDLNTRTLDIILPVGISFYTFQTMSYTIDIYRGKLEPTRDPWQFFAFVSFFPQLVAGPIERATRFLPQFEERKEFNYSRTISGFRLILWGFFKKVVIADNLGLLADALFAHPSDYPGLPMFLGAILFAFQIYGDFSG
ncbi:MAG TPA: membrane-bound O-acyltransferase family protein, partial [Cryomorphaceae bacterium]|nr:membrane-bound O-acyltransferase family protein [Cryomorphaceae bacterium]